MLHRTALVFLAGTFLLSSLLSAPGASASSKIFDNISGSWRGKGFVTTSSEASEESIRCRMKNQHDVGTRKVSLSGNCAVAGFVFSLRGFIQQEGTKNAYQASMFRSLANLKQSTFSGKRSGNNINFTFKARDRISKQNVSARIVLVTKGGNRFDVQLSRTDPKTKKLFKVGTIKFTKR